MEEGERQSIARLPSAHTLTQGLSSQHEPRPGIASVTLVHGAKLNHRRSHTGQGCHSLFCKTSFVAGHFARRSIYPLQECESVTPTALPRGRPSPYISLGTFPAPQEGPSCPLSVNPVSRSPVPQPEVTTDLLFVSLLTTWLITS